MKMFAHNLNNQFGNKNKENRKRNWPSSFFDMIFLPPCKFIFYKNSSTKMDRTRFQAKR